jgi:hypothetical protein
VSSTRQLVAENKRIILGFLLSHLRIQRSGYRGHAAIAADQLIVEFTRRARFEEQGPPPGHAALPGLEALTADRCDPNRGYHSDPHRGCALR